VQKYYSLGKEVFLVSKRFVTGKKKRRRSAIRALEEEEFLREEREIGEQFYLDLACFGRERIRRILVT